MDDDAVEDLNDLALEQLLCPVCTEYCKPPIRQCANGHNICITCRKKLAKCALCKGSLAGVRNKFAELLVSKVKYPCVFKSTGCELKFKRRFMDDHLKECPCAIRCQLKARSKRNPKLWEPCSWHGGVIALADHVNVQHKPFISKTSEATHYFQLRRKTDTRLVQCWLQQFWSILAYDFQTYTLRAIVFLVGLKNEATDYTFKYELLSREQKHAIVHQGDVVSVENMKANLVGYFDQFDCGVCDTEDNTLLFRGRDVLKQFIDQGVLKCRVTVVRKDGV